MQVVDSLEPLAEMFQYVSTLRGMTKCHDATTFGVDKMSEKAMSSEENDMGQQNIMEFGSVSDSHDTSEGQTLASSLNPPKAARRKGFSSHVRPKGLNKGKSDPSSGRMGKKVEVQEKSVPEVAEPRKSNCRIRPSTSYYSFLYQQPA